MAFLSNAVLDGPGTVLSGNRVLHITDDTGEPTTPAEVLARSLASVVLDAADFTQADGDASGRKTTVAAQSGVLVSTTGDAAFYAVLNSPAEDDLLLTNDLGNPQPLTSGNQINLSAFDVEFQDPTSV